MSHLDRHGKNNRLHANHGAPRHWTTHVLRLRELFTGLILPAGIPAAAILIGTKLGSFESATLLASTAWTALVAGAGWLSVVILFRFGHHPTWRLVLVGILCLFAVTEGCNRIDPTANYRIGDPEASHENVRGR